MTRCCRSCGNLKLDLFTNSLPYLQSMSTTSNQLIGAVTTWRDIHASLMKLDLSTVDLSSDRVMEVPFSSSSSARSSYTTDSFLSYISDDCTPTNELLI